MSDAVAPLISITVDRTTGRGHVSGLKRCASPLCPVCGPRLARKRAAEITEVVERHLAAGGTAVLATFTIPHRADDRLDDLLNALQKAYTAVMSGKSRTVLGERFGVAETIRAIETTAGDGGWNPHLHAVWLVEPGFDRPAELWMYLMARWQAAVRRTLGRETSLTYAVELAPITDPDAVGSYVADTGWSIGAELASGPIKLGRRGGRWSPMSLLASAACWGDLDALDRWQEFEHAMANRRTMSASRGFYGRYGVRTVTDEEAVVDEPESPGVTVDVEVHTWQVLAAIGVATEYVIAVEVWAAAGCRGRPPDPMTVAAEAIDARRWASAA